MTEYDFKSFTFGVGAHASREDGMCVMEAVAYVAGEHHSDSPQCASPVISAFLRRWNDSIKDDDRRRELLSPFVFRLVGTKATAEIELKRSWMAFDWLVRECLPGFLELTKSLKHHANDLRNLPEINQHNFDLAIPIINAAGAAAWDAAGAAAGDALMPTVVLLQDSAASLVDRMIRLTETAEAAPKEIACEKV